MHQGVHYDAGTRMDMDDWIAESLVSRGLAKATTLDAPTPPMPVAERDPIATAQLEELGALNVTVPTVPDKSSMPTRPHPRRR
jgi:hypothetical protein